MKYLLLGYGIANKSVEKFLQASNIPYQIYDDYLIDFRENLNFDNIIKIVKSSGIFNNHFIIKKAIEKNIPVVSDLELFYSFFPDKKYITVTGSNGKTTTVSLLYDIFKKANININLGGNIGEPIFDFYLSKEDLIIEASSFMLEYINYYHPHIACILNISYAHLDHHLSLENYKNCKAKLFSRQSPNDYFVYNADDENIKSLLGEVKANKIPFSRTRRVPGAYLVGPHIYFLDQYIISKDEIKLIGDHNIDNILACISMAMCANIKPEIIASSIANFKGIAHRIEYVSDFRGLKVYNDSKSTNLSALKSALEVFKNDKTILICGGKYKDDNFSILDGSIKNINKIFIYGENRNVFYNYFKNKEKTIFVFETLEEVIECLKKQLLEEEIILFSPGSSSQDQFKNFEERGRKFKNYMV